jgi:hypothetical protein
MFYFGGRHRIELYIQVNTVDMYGKGGIYALVCLDCGKRYLGQTGSNFR